MRRFTTLALGLALASLASAGTGHAADPYLKLAGHISYSNPVTTTIGSTGAAPVGGITQTMDPCTPGGPNAGVDGMWFALPSDGSLDGVKATLSFPDKLGLGPHQLPVLGKATLGTDMDVSYYTKGCTDTGYTGMGTSSDPEVGKVPAGSAFVYVQYYMGTPDIDFTLEIGSAPAA